VGLEPVEHRELVDVGLVPQRPNSWPIAGQAGR
jgi:hypothetical protein